MKSLMVIAREQKVVAEWLTLAGILKVQDSGFNSRAGCLH
jgi:hypothetical protein